MQMKTLLLSAVFAMTIVSVHAGIPQMMNYQGKLTDASGRLVADGGYEMIFSIQKLSGSSESAYTCASETRPNRLCASPTMSSYAPMRKKPRK